MLIIGAIITVISIIMTILGGALRNDWKYEWADAVFVIGIIALVIGIIVVILGLMNKSSGGGNQSFASPRKLVDVPVSTASKKFVCAKCGADVTVNMAFCSQCGCADKIEKNINPVNVQQKQAFCHNCGAGVTPGEAFCHQCGTKV